MIMIERCYGFMFHFLMKHHPKKKHIKQSKVTTLFRIYTFRIIYKLKTLLLNDNNIHDEIS